MTTLRRVLWVLLFGFLVLAFWAWLAKTPWGHTVNPFTAGRRYPDPVHPILHIGVVLGIVTPTVILLRAGWKWFAQAVLGRTPPARIPGSTRKSG